MDKYKSHKVVEAAKIVNARESIGINSEKILSLKLEDEEASIDIRGNDAERFIEMSGADLLGGYYISYPDGYESWSPAKAFEEGYTKGSALKISGYRNLTDDEKNNINAIKAWGVSMHGIIETLANANQMPHTHDENGKPIQGTAESYEEAKANSEAQRWIAIGKTHIQQGLMALTRAIAKPEGF